MQSIYICLTCFVLAAIANAVQWTITFRFNRSILTKWPNYFGPLAWRNKWKLHMGTGTLIPAPSTWYYKLFKLKYKEKYLLSGTALAWTTDGFHGSQHIRTALLITAMMTFNWDINSFYEGSYTFLLFAGLWGFVFEMFYSYFLLQKK